MKPDIGKRFNARGWSLGIETTDSSMSRTFPVARNRASCQSVNFRFSFFLFSFMFVWSHSYRSSSRAGSARSVPQTEKSYSIESCKNPSSQSLPVPNHFFQLPLSQSLLRDRSFHFD